MRGLCAWRVTPSLSRSSSRSSPTSVPAARGWLIVSSASEPRATEGPMAEFHEWESFYVIVGTAAAALIGLQFVVMTLIAERPSAASPEGGAAFATPTVVHFCAVLLLSAILRVPWKSLTTIAILWGLVGAAGAAYGAIVMRRMRRQKAYQPDLEDWLFHGVLPWSAYVLLFASAFVAMEHVHEAMLGLATAVLALLFVAIHNVWDTVAYQVFVLRRKAKDE